MGLDAPPRTLTLQGELDAASIRAVAGDLSEAVGDMSQDVCVDLRRVTFMDSTALSAFVRAATQMRNQGRRLTLLVAPGSPVDGLLDVTGVRSCFEIAEA